MSKIVCGLDEVGRGSLAGPMVLCAVSIYQDSDLKELLKDLVFRDSKKMTRNQRIQTYKFLKEVVCSFDIEVVDVQEINNKGIGVCNVEGFKKLIDRNRADKYYVDGNLKIERENTESVVKADTFIDSVTAASIIAKVTRDNIMFDLDKYFPNYDFKNNVGYGTNKHIQAIKKFGITNHHRTKFVESIVKLQSNFTY